jgi:hypothetical protein
MPTFLELWKKGTYSAATGGVSDLAVGYAVMKRCS